MRQQKARAIWPPQPGLFSLRLVKNGWKVPARISHTEAGWHAEIDGEAQPANPNPERAAGVDTIWHSGDQIDQQTYDHLQAIREYAREHDPDHPSLRPRTAMDHRTLRPIYPS